MKQLGLKLISNENNYKKNINYNLILENIHNNIYANDGLSPNDALEVVINILFLKTFDELKSLNYFYITNKEYLQLINGKNSKNFLSRIENLRIQTYKHFIDLFNNQNRINIKNSTLAFIVKSLSNIDILKTYDLFGKAFLKYLSSVQRNSRGQFFTPDEIIKFCVNILKPTKNDNILDPACGSASFLISSINYINQKEKTKINIDNVYGIEINITAAKIAKLNMILSNSSHKNILTSDSLKDFKELEKNFNSLKKNKIKNFFDLIITNPPFGTSGKISNKSILKNFKLACKWNENDNFYINSEKLLSHQVPEILFIERCIDFLKPKGKMAIVLPNGNLENPSLKYVRQFINYNCNILAIIKLPQDAFVYSGTGIKTSILFLQKKELSKVGLNNANSIFFSEIKKIGFSANKTGKNLFKKDELGNTIKDENNKSVIDEDCSDVLCDYNEILTNKKPKNKKSFLVDQKSFSYSRFNYEYYNPKFKEIYLNFNNKNSLKLKDLVNVRKLKSKKLLSSNLSISYVELSDVISDYSEIQKSEILKVYQLPSRASYDIKEGEIITSVSGNAIGTKKHASAIVSKKFSESICSNGFRVFYDFSKKIDKYYLLYYFKTKLFLDQIFRLRTGSAIPTIQDDDLMNIYVYLPSGKKMHKISKLIKKGFEEREKFKSKISKIKFY